MVYVFTQTALTLNGLTKPDPKVSDMAWVSGREGVQSRASQAMGGARPGGGGSGSPPPSPTVRGLPLLKPPYGSLVAINLDKGDIAWKIAHGETPDNVRNSPELKGLKIPRTGRPGLLSPLVTKTLVIIGEAGFFTTPSGARGAMLRAYDKATGKEMGAVYMPAPQSGSPMTYMLNGKQYIVLAISGANYPGELLAFRLPDSGGAVQARQEAPAAPAASVAANGRPDYTAAQAARGKSLYEGQCAVCHGAALEGIEMGPSLAGGEFLDRWSGQPLGDFFERIRSTMPKGKPGSLSPAASADIVAYILSANHYRAGAAELPSDRQVLNRIRIETPK
jgi:mono/diheme cytochrome c family protein